LAGVGSSFCEVLLVNILWEFPITVYKTLICRVHFLNDLDISVLMTPWGSQHVNESVNYYRIKLCFGGLLTSYLIAKCLEAGPGGRAV